MSLTRVACVLSFAFLTVACALGQTPESQWTVGTITSVKAQRASTAEKSPHRYDISIRVGDTIYDVIYEQEPGTTLVQYREGVELTMLVGEKSLKFNDIRGNVREVPIVNRRPARTRDQHGNGE